MAWFGRPRPQRVRHADWIGRATIGFALPAILTLALLHCWSALYVLPSEFDALAVTMPRYSASALVPALAAGLLLGALIVIGRVVGARRRRRPIPRDIVAAAPLAARSRRELLPAIATALAAGVTEELAFRLTIPLLVARLSGSGLLGFGIATALFVALHRYQRWPGRIGVALSGVVLAALYLSTGALWLAIALHAAIDVMALAIRPCLAGFTASVATPSGRSKR